MIATIWLAVFGCFCSLSDRRSIAPPGGGIWWARGVACAGGGGGGLYAGAFGATPGMEKLRALKTNWRTLMRRAAAEAAKPPVHQKLSAEIIRQHIARHPACAAGSRDGPHSAHSSLSAVSNLIRL